MPWPGSGTYPFSKNTSSWALHWAIDVKLKGEEDKVGTLLCTYFVTSCLDKHKAITLLCTYFGVRWEIHPLPFRKEILLHAPLAPLS